MVKRGSYDNLYEIQQKITMSQDISRLDSEFGLFAGADPETAQRIATVELALKQGLYANELQKTLMMLYKSHLDLKRKAWFAATCSELSKLGFIRGYTRTVEEF